MNAPVFNGRTPSGRIVGRTDQLDLRTLNKWRAVIYDRLEGIVVVDVNADSENDAKGTALTAAQEVLKLTRIASIIVKRHSDMPTEWLRYQTRSLDHVKTKKGKKF